MASHPSLFSAIPHGATLGIHPFQVHFPEEDIQSFKTLLSLSKIGPEVYENTANSENLGLRREWLQEAKDEWLHNYDWKQTEVRINSFPNFTTPIPHKGDCYTVHFAALFSQKQDALPLLLLHGWPGSFLEFLDVVEILRHRYTETSLPYHIIVPSLPGYGFSSGPVSHRASTLDDQAEIMDLLMVGLGFRSGYLVQGGDIGSFLGRILGATSPHCKAVHLNFCAMNSPDNVDEECLTELELRGLLRSREFAQHGFAYAALHGTRPATIGLALSTSPLALLCWIGEKYLEWSDARPSLSHILDTATLYWLTETFPRSIFPYRNAGSPPENFHGSKEYHLSTPLGFSYYPKEIAPCPVAWVKTTGNLVWHKIHETGGHFAAWENPTVFVEDLDSFIACLRQHHWQDEKII